MPGQLKQSRPQKAPRRAAGGEALFHELVPGMEAMREHREGRLKLRAHEIAPIEA